MVTIDRLTTGYVGLSTDEKPTGCRNGDTFIEMDTCTLYAYDEAGQQWLKQSGSGGGSSEALSANVTFINSDDGFYYVVINGTTYSIADSQTVTIDLLGGYALIPYDAFTEINTDVSAIMTGKIVETQNGFLVTGDGTITIAGTGGK